MNARFHLAPLVAVMLLSFVPSAFANWFDAETGRWLKRDPAGYVDTPNLYNYVNNMPLTRVDPAGLRAVPCNGKDLAGGGAPGGGGPGGACSAFGCARGAPAGANTPDPPCMPPAPGTGGQCCNWTDTPVIIYPENPPGAYPVVLPPHTCLPCDAFVPLPDTKPFCCEFGYVFKVVNGCTVCLGQTPEGEPRWEEACDSTWNWWRQLLGGGCRKAWIEY